MNLKRRKTTKMYIWLQILQRHRCIKNFLSWLSVVCKNSNSIYTLCSFRDLFSYSSTIHVLELVLITHAQNRSFVAIAVHSRPQRLCSFWSAPTIGNSGEVQFSEHAQSNRLVLLANQICQTWLWACDDWREVCESQTSVVGPSQRSRSFFQKERGL